MVYPKPRITRTRSGCLTCRRRHTKCDEAKPHCHTCTRLGLPCAGYGGTVAFRDGTVAVRERVMRLNKRKEATSVHIMDRKQPRMDKPGNRDPHPSLADDIPEPVYNVNPTWPWMAPEPHAGQTEVANHTPSPCPLLASPPNEIIIPVASTNKIDTLTQPGDDVNVASLSQHFPLSLSPVLREIWEGVGYSHPVLRLSLLALGAVDKSDIQKDALELYSRALQAMTEYMPSRMEKVKVTDALVLLAVLTILQMLEMTFGSFLGGITHCKQADYIMTHYIQQLMAWGTGCRMIRAWVPLKCWYSMQCAPWQEISHPFPAEIRGSLWDVLQPSTTSPDTLLALLCTARKLNLQLTLLRLFRRGVSRDGFHIWSRQLQLLGKQAPEKEEFEALTEEDILIGLAGLRARLDHWHSQQDVTDLPIVRATSERPERLLSLHPSLGPAPLVFRSSLATSNYLRYAAAQALASTESLEALLSSKPGDPQAPDRWTRLTMQIIAGLETSLPLQEEGVSIGLVWILLNVVLLRGPGADIFHYLRAALPRLQEPGNSRCALCPFWVLGDVIQRIEDQHSRGRLVLHLESDIGAGEELSLARSTPLAYRTLVLGYDVKEQCAFSVVDDGSTVVD
ncbi:hypothetical protein BDV10DRAFT_179375 [Aspergillus recurvatus]